MLSISNSNNNNNNNDKNNNLIFFLLKFTDQKFQENSANFLFAFLPCSVPER